jgi:putative two-component system response regulator
MLHSPSTLLDKFLHNAQVLIVDDEPANTFPLKVNTATDQENSADGSTDSNGVDILIVEDSPTQALRLKFTLERQGHQVVAARNGTEALNFLQEHRPTLVLSDIMMPGMDGYELCRHIKADADLKDVPVILLTSLSDPKDIIEGLNCGADNFIAKPYEEELLLFHINGLLKQRQLDEDARGTPNGVPNNGNNEFELFFQGQKHVLTAERSQIVNLLLATYETVAQKNIELDRAKRELEERIRERTRALEESQIETLERLARAAEFRDDDTGRHTYRVGRRSALLAKVLGLPRSQVEFIRRAAPLHDIGKIGIPDDILLKPGKLTPNEFTVMKTHASIGASLLSGGQSDLVQLAESIAHTHHERWDGTGYPRELKEKEIPIEGRILAVVDVFDALIHVRPYKKAWPMDEALHEIKRQSGRQFDPLVVEAFLTLSHDELD